VIRGAFAVHMPEKAPRSGAWRETVAYRRFCATDDRAAGTLASLPSRSSPKP
jgi:hypothetical protein